VRWGPWNPLIGLCFLHSPSGATRSLLPHPPGGWTIFVDSLSHRRFGTRTQCLLYQSSPPPPGFLLPCPPSPCRTQAWAWHPWLQNPSFRGSVVGVTRTLTLVLSWAYISCLLVHFSVVLCPSPLRLFQFVFFCSPPVTWSKRYFPRKPHTASLYPHQTGLSLEKKCRKLCGLFQTQQLDKK